MLHCNGASGPQASPAQPVALGEETWIDGVYLDVPKLKLGDGYVLTGSITPQVGNASLLPVNSPVIDGTGIGGRDAIYIDATNLQYLIANELASLANSGPLSVAVRVKRNEAASTRALWGFGDSTQSTTDYFYAAFPGGAANSPVVNRSAVGDGIKSLTGPAPLVYTDYVICFVYDGVDELVYLDGNLIAQGPVGTLALTPNRFVIGARHTTAPLNYLGGWISKFAMVPKVLTIDEVQELTAHWTAHDWGTPGKADGAPFQFFGDSITQGDSDTDGRGGFRYDMYEYLRTNRLRVTFVGHRDLGYFANPEHSAHGGLTTNSINNYINTYAPTYMPRGLFVLAGTNDSDNIESGGKTLATWRGEYDALLVDARAQLDAVYSEGQIIVGTLLPIEPGTLGAAVIDDMNAELVAAWNAHDAANPTKPPLIRCDFHTAIGGTWSATYFGADPVHPNGAGYRLMGAELVAQAGSYFNGATF